MDGDEGAVARARADLTKASQLWWFRTAAAVFTAAFAVIGAMLPPDAEPGERIALAVAGTLGGVLLVSLFVFAVFVAIAPVRQRNDARDEGRTTVAEKEREFARTLAEVRQNAKETHDALRAERDALQQRLDDRERLKAVRTKLGAYAAQGKVIARQGRRAPDHPETQQDWAVTATKWFDEVRAFLGEAFDEGEVEVFADTTGVQPNAPTHTHEYRVSVVEHCVGNLVHVIGQHPQP